MTSKKPHEKTHNDLDLLFRTIFLIFLIIFVLIFIYKIYYYPDRTSVLGTITALIFLFAYCGGFFLRLKSIKIGPFGAEFLDIIEKEKKLESTTLELIKSIYDNIPEDYPLEPIEGIIDASSLTTEDLLQLKKFNKILEELQNV